MKKPTSLEIAGLLCLALAGLLALLHSEESRVSPTSRTDFHSPRFFRECAQWDILGQRFIVSFLGGGLGQVRNEEVDRGSAKEDVLVQDRDLKGNSSLGFKIDNERQRVVVVVADAMRNRYSGLAAYDMKSWERIYFTKLAGAERVSLADDVALDPEGNAYVTDAKANLIWKISFDGAQVSILTSSSAFSSQKNRLPFNLVGLNGIAYHPDGYLLVVHTWSGTLFKVSIDGSSVVKINVNGDLLMGDGITLVSPSKLAVAAITKVLLVESNDGWKTARVTHRYGGPRHRLSTAVTVKGDRVFVNFANALPVGIFRYFATIGEAVFEPFKSS